MGDAATVPPSFMARVRVEARGTRWRATLGLRGASDFVEHRTIDADDCESLARAFALIVAVRIDVLRVAQPPPPPPPVVPEPSSPVPTEIRPPRATTTEPRTAAPPTPQPSASRSTTPARPVRGLVRIEGGLAGGILPGVGGGVGLMTGVFGPRWRFETGAMAWPARSATDPSDAVTVRLDLVAGRARGCGGPATERLMVPMCVGAEIAGLRGVGTTGVTQPNVRWTVWGAVSIGAGLVWALRPWIAPYMGLEGSIPVVQPRFAVGDTPVTRTGAVGARLWAGVELHFGSRRRARARTKGEQPAP